MTSTTDLLTVNNTLNTNLSDYQNLIDAGYVSARKSHCGRLITLKYSRKAAFDKNVWQANPLMKFCRGHVYGVETGRLVAAPFKKFFHIDEDLGGYRRFQNRNGDFVLVDETDISDEAMISVQFVRSSEQVLVYEKVNGSMAHVTFDPSSKRIIIGTTGAACYIGDAQNGTNEFLKRLEVLVTPHIEFIHHWDYLNGGESGFYINTFVFEVVDETNDPHIVRQEEGLWLLGLNQRSRRVISNNSFIMPFDHPFHKPHCRFMTLKEAIEYGKNSKKEGVVIRAGVGYNSAIKVKSDFYTAAKLIARATEKNYKTKLEAARKIYPKFFDSEYFAKLSEDGYFTTNFLAQTEQERLVGLGVK